jgi:hypothetical protein
VKGGGCFHVDGKVQELEDDKVQGNDDGETGFEHMQGGRLKVVQVQVK